MHNFIETILRKFKASKVNSLQNKSLRRNQIENHPIQTVVCFITVYCVLYLPFFVGNILDSKMNTIPVWMHGLALYLGMTSYTANSLVYSILNRKMKYSILNFARNFFPKWNQSWDMNKILTGLTPFYN